VCLKYLSGIDWKTVLIRWWNMVRQTVTDNPELFFPVFLILVWRITDVAAKPRTLVLAFFLTGILLVYGFRVLGGSLWLRRLGWVSPHHGFWLYSVVAGMIAGGAVWLVARALHESLGTLPPPHLVLLASSSGSILEELLFRGLLFWFVLELCRRLRWPQRPSAVATVILVAIAFAFAHLGRTGASLYSTVLTGIAFGAIRIWSDPTAAAALMHATYNFTLSWMSLF
jgi:hypothetical protein